MKRLAITAVCILLMFSIVLSAINIITVRAFEIDQITMCTSITDGDTFQTSYGTIRLADIDCPEFGDPGYVEATDLLTSLIYEQRVYLDIDDLYQTDPYNRYVCVVAVQANATHYLNVNQYLLENSAYAELRNYENEFDPFTWDLYYPIESSSPNSHIDPTPLGDYVVINEFEPNPAGYDEGNEWAELYNPTSDSIDIGGWSLTTTQGVTVTVTIPADTVIEADGYYLVEWAVQWIDNDDESLILRDALDQEVDHTAVKSDSENDGRTWARFPNGYDTDSDQDWTFQQGTRGTSNGRRSSSVSCMVSSSSLIQGSLIVVTGTLNPAQADTTILLSYTAPDQSVTSHNVLTNVDGQYSDSYLPNMLGTWEVQASWAGDTYHHSTSSIIRTFTVTLSPTDITCTTDATSISVGTPILLDGSLTPSMATPISILYSTDTTWQTLTDLTTLSDGSYHYSWTPTTPATHRFKAIYAGDDTYAPSESVVLTIPLTKTASSITCSCPSTVSEGKTVTVTGGVDPAMNDRTVTLTYQKPNGGTLTRTVTTDTNGEYSDTYTPSETGVWRVTASWEGDETYESATSSAMSFTVEKSGCLIATATYGSELTPQVQFLRTFRDDRVLQTFAGSQFMNVFNSFYYSWSPNVADTIRTHSGVATAMKPALYPLIDILHVSEGLFSVLSVNPELAVVTTGFVASALIAGIYLLPLTLLISYFRKQAVLRTLVAAIGVIWLESLCAIVLAELTQSAALMMTATGTFVLATMGATVLSMMTMLPSFLKKCSRS